MGLMFASVVLGCFQFSMFWDCCYGNEWPWIKNLVWKLLCFNLRQPGGLSHLRRGGGGVKMTTSNSKTKRDKTAREKVFDCSQWVYSKIFQLLFRSVKTAIIPNIFEVGSPDLTWWPDRRWPWADFFLKGAKLIYEKVCKNSWCGQKDPPTRAKINIVKTKNAAFLLIARHERHISQKNKQTSACRHNTWQYMGRRYIVSDLSLLLIR